MITAMRAGAATLTVALQGRLDAGGAAALRPAMEFLAAEAPPRVVLDLQGVAYMDGAGLGALAYLAKRLGRRVRLEGASGQPLALLRHLGLDEAFGLPAPRRASRPAAGFAWGGSPA